MTFEATIGHNVGDVDIATQVRDNLAEKFRDLAKRAVELASMIERAPTEVDNETDANKLSEAIRMCTAFEKSAEGARVEAKEPYLQAGRSVDGYFKTMVEPVSRTKSALNKVRTAYDIKVEAEERRVREEAARKAREEADRLAETARTAAQQDRAAVAEQQAEQAAQAAKVTAAELTRTRTETGVGTSLRVEWRGEIVEPGRVPRKYCVPSEGLIRAAIKAAVQPDGTCPLEIAGVRIYEHKESRVR